MEDPMTLSPITHGKSHTSLDVWRKELAQKILYLLILIGLPFVAQGSYRIFQEGRVWAGVAWLLLFAFSLTVAFWPRISYKVQAAVIVAIFLGFGLLNLVQLGVNAGGPLFILSAVWLTGLFFGKYGARGANLSVLLSLLIIASAFTSGRITVYYPGTSVARSTQWYEWAILILTLFSLSAGLGITQGYLLTRLSEALARSRKLTQYLDVERVKLERKVNERTRSLQEAQAETEAANEALRTQMWLVTGRAQLNDAMRGEQTLSVLADKVIGQLCRYLDLPAGALYLREQTTLHLRGRYAYAAQSPTHINLGEGLAGQAARDRKVRIFGEIPEAHFLVASGLGQTPPRYVMVAPFVYEDRVTGVLELGSLQPFTSIQVQFVEHVLETIAVAFNTARSRERINALLAETQNQTVELQSQQEELRTVNEELQSQADSLHIGRERRGNR